MILYFQRINVSILIVDPKFLADMGLLTDTAGQGLLMTLFLLSYSLMNILSSPLSDKVGASGVILAASFVAATAVFLGGVVASFTALLWIRVFTGVGQGLYFPAQSKLISNWFLPDERGKANSIWAVAGCVGPIVAVPLFTWVITILSWEYVFYITGIVGFLMIIPIITGRITESPNHNTSWLQDRKQKAALNNSQKMQWSDVKDLLSTTNIWLLVISYMALLSLWWGIVTWLPQYLVVARNFDLKSMGIAASLPYFTAGIAMLFGGILADKIKNQAWIGVTGLFGAAVCIIIAVFTKSNIVCTLLIAIGLGFNQLYFAPIWAVLQTMLPVNIVATGSGIMNGFGNFFSGLAPVIIGFLIQITNTYNAGLIYLAVLGLIGSVANLILAMNLKRRHQLS
ncbi:MAG: MFS transporter [Syntrophomonadaceae bacterium]|nr:MFS transporter [Syntrophomonadaceae bacterium]